MFSYEQKLKNARLFIALIDDKRRTSNILKCLDEGADINKQYSDDTNNTPLHIAVIKQNQEAVNLLLERGAKTNFINNEGKTALDIAGKLESDIGKAIVELLETYDRNKYKINEMNKSIILADNKNNPKLLYQKRSGTSGIEGQLYETKLMTLIRIRSFIKEYNELYLGTNLEGVGAFDDICVRYKQNNTDVVVYLQAKHRNEVTKGKVKAKDLWKATGDFSFYKYFESYKIIREKFNKTKEDDQISSSSKHKDTKFYFVIYTPAGSELNVKITNEDNSTDASVRNLIESGEHSDVFRYKYTDEELNLLTKSVLVEQLKCLGKTMYNFIKKGKFDMMLTDYYIRRYHVILARHVINVSDVNDEGYRTGTFCDEFFNNNDELLVTLKEVLFNEVVADTKLNKDKLKELVQVVKLEPTVDNISNLMQTLSICYDNDNNTLVASKETIQNIAETLSETKISYNDFNDARHIAIKEKLSSFCFKLPLVFGNLDIAVRGKKGVKRLDYLAAQLEHVILKFEDKNICINNELIGLDNLIDAGVMELNGGLASAIGNFLISSDDDMSFTFNMNDKTLGVNSKILLELLKSKIKDLDTYQIKINIEGFPKISLKADEYDKILAKDFFNNLWFYTNQAKEDEVEKHSKEILEDYCITSKQGIASSVRYDVIYLKFHDEIQKWWMTEGQCHYLTNDKEYFDNILKEFLDQSLLNTLSSVYITRVKNYDIRFDENSVQSLSVQIEADRTIVVTEVITLTTIKLVQHYQNFNNYAFVDLDSPLLLSRNDKNVLKEEIRTKILQTLIIIYEDVSESKSELFRCLINKNLSKRVIIVTNTTSCEKLHSYVINYNKFIRIKDTEIKLSDLVIESQERVLKNKFIFQGIETNFDNVINKEAIHLITPFIVQKIINNDIIEVGKTLSNANYEEIKDYYVYRNLRFEKESYYPTHNIYYKKYPSVFNKTQQNIKLESLDALNGTVVLAGAAGSGKSTYLTHMSLATKQQNPNLWIERINLLDYTKEFHRWQENKTKIDFIEALKFIFNTAITKITSKKNINYNFDKINIDLEIVNGKLVLKNCEVINDLVLFELEVFVHCYNKGNSILLFDGFDEICPHYKNELTGLLKCLVKRSPAIKSSNTQRMWITSRSYNNIITTLKIEFGDPYELVELKQTEMVKVMKLFFKNNLNINEMDYDQLLNIDGFFKYIKMSRNLTSHDKLGMLFKYNNYFFNLIYYIAFEYFQREIKYMRFTDKKYSLVVKWQSCNKFQYNNLNYSIAISEEDAITPLHLYISLDYFVNLIKNTSLDNTDINAKWNLETSVLLFYKYFLETKMKRIRFGQKNKMNVCNPDVKLTYEKELKEFLEKHKKIAFYAAYSEDLDDILKKNEINEMREIIKEFESGKEKTGIVDYIIDGVPKFIHRTFQEYLAAEYIADLIKTKPIEEMAALWKFIIQNCYTGALEFLDRKFKSDNELQNINLNNEIKQTIFYEIIMNNLKFSSHKERKYSTIIDKTTYTGLRHITIFFFKAIVEVVDEDNINDLMGFLHGYLFHNLADTEWDDIMNMILDCIRKVDRNRLCEFDYGLPKTDFKMLDNKDIIKNIRRKQKLHQKTIGKYHNKM